MIPVELAKTPELSRLKRKYHVIEALYWRKDGNKRMKNHCLSMAKVERINKCEFLGDELPF
ncbi:hypothetical protein EDF88_3917 [Buttiauxella sp. BIGb0552]|jgi:hypothetical protein|uniref:hypothetical protein n=1 Tax=Buttiauxella sp. BIGb0552 TaxID=2485120 RepID=UPI0010662401|nr:hypothetical protein [Buttiauxella sp. BIGb0552]TDX14600.1 hypothetical protein EDF88_3917 [Buttiauxella sp. BIGb0552]